MKPTKYELEKFLHEEIAKDSILQRYEIAWKNGTVTRDEALRAMAERIIDIQGRRKGQ